MNTKGVLQRWSSFFRCVDEFSISIAMGALRWCSTFKSKWTKAIHNNNNRIYLKADILWFSAGTNGYTLYLVPFNLQKSRTSNFARLTFRLFRNGFNRWFYCNSRAHNDRKVRVVKYIVVYGQIKAADQKYCHSQRWRRKLKEISFRTRGFGDNLDDFWPRYCRAKNLDLNRVVEAYL